MPTADDTTAAPADAPQRAPAAGGVVSPPRRRWLRWALGGLAGLIIALIAGVGALVHVGIEANPAVGAFVRDRIVKALQERLDPSLTLAIDSVDLNRGQGGTAVKVSGFTIRDRSGQTLVSAPSGTVTLDTTALASFRLVPTDVVLDGLKVAVDISESGAFSIAAARAETGESAATPSDAPPPERLQQLISAAFAALAATREAVGGKLPSLGVQNATLAIHDKRTNRQVTVPGLSTRIVSAADGAATARIERTSGESAWGVTVDVSARNNEGQTFTARSERMTVSHLMALAGLKIEDVDGASPALITIQAKVDAALQAREASADVVISQAAIAYYAPQRTQARFEEISASLGWSEASGAFAIRSLKAISGALRVDLVGEATPPRATGEPWSVRLTAKEKALNGLTPADKPVVVDQLALDLSIWPEQQRLQLTRGDLSGPFARVRMTAVANLDASGRPELKLEVNASDTEVRTALRLWPAFAVPEVRLWLGDNLKSGQLDSLSLRLDFRAQALEDALAGRPVADEDMNVEWRMSRSALTPVVGAPPLKDAQATGLATGRTLRIAIAQGVVEPAPGRRLLIPEGSFTVADTSKFPTEARVRLRFSGGADGLADLIRSPGFREHNPVEIDPSTLKGAVDGEANIWLRLVEKMGPNDIRVGINASLKGMTIDKAIGDDKIEAGNFQLTVDRQTFLIKGDARIFGTPATIELRSAGKAKPRATIAMTVDEALRNRRGFNLGGFLTGPIGVRIVTDLDAPDDRDMAVEVDLARAKLEGVIPGWLKPAGQPARAKAKVTGADGGGWQLDDIEFDAGTVSVRGSATLASDGQFVKAALPVFKVSQGDNARMDIDRAGNVLRLNVRANTIDVRPFLRSLQTGAIDKSGGKDTEVTVRSTVLAGFNGEVVANADIKLALRGSEMRRFDMTGNFDGGVITTRLTSRPGSQPQLLIDSEDAGAFLRFFDMYNRMQGGRLTLGAVLGSGSQTGTILIRDFVLRNEPAMKRLVADGNASFGAGDLGRFDPAFVQRLNANQDVKFTKMTVEFARNSARLTLKDAVIWGPDIGGSMTGYLDYLRDRVELTGTFVPAYAVNNLFAQVPLFGPLLGGGRNEGLFAVRYNITGKVSAPTLSINPLTAIAPGFLRKLIDIRGAPGSSAPRPPPSGSER